ncbi:MAG: hypothetical protein QM666_04875, partial [Acinetobacter sp.]
KLNLFDPEKPIGNFSLHMLEEIISGYLVNLKSEVDIYLPTVHEWLDFAIDRKDPFGEGDSLTYYHAELFQGKALALWMSDHINAPQYWEQARQLWSGFDDPARTVYSKNKFKTDFLDDYLQLCVQSGQYQEGIERFEKYYGQKAISIKKKMTAREYGYLLCQNALAPKYSQHELVDAGQKMLTKYMEAPWLSMGLYSQAAIWLKIVYWDNQNTTTAYETILKAYESMPNIEALSP